MTFRAFREMHAMPTYEYRCEKCGKRFAVIERISDHTGRPPACPKCRSRATRQLPAAFYAKTVKKS
ncbi:MAG TPA: zinc ribbon domain-containing protein [Gemmatimonadales bacterium]|nr:zinc ribbon domain-containing protein [Gemmatimonadales bacterium]